MDPGLHRDDSLGVQCKSIEKYVKAQELADDLAKMLGEAKDSINLDAEEDIEDAEEEE